MPSRSLIVCLGVLGFLLSSVDAYAQRAGQSMTVRVGTVTALRSVDLNDGNAVGGALVGGAFGAALTRSKSSSSKRNRNAAIGAVLGGVAAGSSRRPGRIYTVALSDGSLVQIATEQTELRIDDCVYIEEASGTSNIRRAPSTACETKSAALLKETDVLNELREDAAECSAAKQELVGAETDEAIDRAVRKVKLLCYE